MRVREMKRRRVVFMARIFLGAIVGNLEEPARCGEVNLVALRFLKAFIPRKKLVTGRECPSGHVTYFLSGYDLCESGVRFALFM